MKWPPGNDLVLCPIAGAGAWLKAPSVPATRAADKIPLARVETGLAPWAGVCDHRTMTVSPYLFRASDHPMHIANDRLKVREAISGFGIALRYQERAPGGPEGKWCETGHSIFILSGRLRYQFDDHTVEAGPGDMLHIPAGGAHRHKPSVVGAETVRYVLTEFG